MHPSPDDVAAVLGGSECSSTKTTSPEMPVRELAEMRIDCAHSAQPEQLSSLSSTEQASAIEGHISRRIALAGASRASFKPDEEPAHGSATQTSDSKQFWLSELSATATANSVCPERSSLHNC